MGNRVSVCFSQLARVPKDDFCQAPLMRARSVLAVCPTKIGGIPFEASASTRFSIPDLCAPRVESNRTMRLSVRHGRVLLADQTVVDVAETVLFGTAVPLTDGIAQNYSIAVPINIRLIVRQLDEGSGVEFFLSFLPRLLIKFVVTGWARSIPKVAVLDAGIESQVGDGCLGFLESRGKVRAVTRGPKHGFPEATVDAE